MKTLNLGAGKTGLKEDFNVDFFQFDGVDLVWNLEACLPAEHVIAYDKVKAISVLEHLGNPLDFLRNCRLYLKDNGVLELQTDNADYWGFHFESLPFRKYHATLWDAESKADEVGHKMMFQKPHLERLLRLAGFKEIKVEYGGCINTLDCLFGKKFGSHYLKAQGVK